tara:strand:+ start:108 stop:308 length:201 start_codon:yes stop_codon:yes gene_type:complete
VGAEAVEAVLTKEQVQDLVVMVSLVYGQWTFLQELWRDNQFKLELVDLVEAEVKLVKQAELLILET